MTIKEILEERAKLKAEIDGASEARLAEIEARVKELDGLEAEIKAEQRKVQLRGSLAKKLTGEANDGKAKVIDSAESREAFDPSALDDNELRETPEYRSAFLKNLQNKELDDSEKRVLTTGTGATAAVPNETLNMVIDKLRQTSVLFGKIGVSFMGGNVSFVVANAIYDASWKSEGTDGTPADDTVTNVTLSGYELIKLVEISAAAEAMTTSSFEAYIVAEISRKMSIAIENAILNGAGSASDEPTGIFTGVTFGTSNSKTYTTLSYDDIVDVTVLLPTMYHQKAEFVCSRTFALGDIRKIKDTNGNPIFVPSTVAGQPSTVLGYPVTIDDYMPDDTTLLFGDMSYYKMNFAKPVEIASDRSVGFKSGKITYRGLAVADGKPVLDEAFTKLSK
jgi:HK97 family phage major capsid protein